MQPHTNLQLVQIINTSEKWFWKNGKLWHQQAREQPSHPIRQRSKLQSWFVGAIYADQNKSKSVRNAIKRLTDSSSIPILGANIGAGNTRFNGLFNVEIADSPNTDIITSGSELPFKDSSLDLVIMQEVLEHIADFQKTIEEVHRVLKPGGKYFCQVPFQIGFHPGPCDYWRFTRQAYEHIFSQPGWRIEELSISLGHGSGMYRIAVEFVAVTSSCIYSRLYKPAKIAACIALYPLKFFDLITNLSPEKDRIPGGYYCVAVRSE